MSETLSMGNQPTEEKDPNAVQRKQDHIELAFKSQVSSGDLDSRFYYEPMLVAHPKPGSLPAFDFLGFRSRAPLWVSSMTGGTGLARTINHNLARACGEFGFGMGLGSCRSLLYSDEYLPDFAVKSYMPDQPLYANLGIAQLEELVLQKNLDPVKSLIDKLQADGLIIHVNPFQEWLQPEGDRFQQSPLATIEQVLEGIQHPIIVKEVGQGMGFKSLKALLQLPLAAVDFAASGGTNFALLELLRSDPDKKHNYAVLTRVGHSAFDMVNMVNQLKRELGPNRRVDQIIISGGVKSFLDGYYLTEKIDMPAIYGQASAFLKYARESYEDLREYTAAQIRGLELARAYLTIRP
jgi:isopentenyl-diphosphate delta-isomerase